MKFVVCHTITIALHTLGSKGEIVVENTESGLNVFGDLFPILILLEHHLKDSSS